jgi:hypothetical protein
MCYILSKCRGAIHYALLLCVLLRDCKSRESNTALLLLCQGEIRESTSVVLSCVYLLSKSDPSCPASIVGLGCNRL